MPARALRPGSCSLPPFRADERAQPMEGKRSGARVVYYYVDRRGTIYLIMAYPRNVKENLTEAEKKVLREIARRLEEES